MYIYLRGIVSQFDKISDCFRYYCMHTRVYIACIPIGTVIARDENNTIYNISALKKKVRFRKSQNGYGGSSGGFVLRHLWIHLDGSARVSTPPNGRERAGRPVPNPVGDNIKSRTLVVFQPSVVFYTLSVAIGLIQWCALVLFPSANDLSPWIMLQPSFSGMVSSMDK